MIGQPLLESAVSFNGGFLGTFKKDLELDGRVLFLNTIRFKQVRTYVRTSQVAQYVKLNTRKNIAEMTY